MSPASETGHPLRHAGIGIVVVAVALITVGTALQRSGMLPLQAQSTGSTGGGGLPVSPGLLPAGTNGGGLPVNPGLTPSGTTGGTQADPNAIGFCCSKRQEGARCLAQTTWEECRQASIEAQGLGENAVEGGTWFGEGVVSAAKGLPNVPRFTLDGVLVTEEEWLCTRACDPLLVNIVCGNGITEGEEECDDGNQNNTDSCTTSCKFAACGDGITQPLGGDPDPGVPQDDEQCDDGNDSNEDSCTILCQTARCGDGWKQPGEACDDGNQNNTDSCTNTCTVNGIAIPPFPPAGGLCGDGNLDAGESCEFDTQCSSGQRCNKDPLVQTPCTCQSIPVSCGDGIKQPAEVCDPTASTDPNKDRCTTACELYRCGDGYTQPAGADGIPGNADDEQCDYGPQGNSICTPQCTWKPYCGDGVKQAGEECEVMFDENGSAVWGQDCINPVDDPSDQQNWCSLRDLTPGNWWCCSTLQPIQLRNWEQIPQTTTCPGVSFTGGNPYGDANGNNASPWECGLADGGGQCSACSLCGQANADVVTSECTQDVCFTLGGGNTAQNSFCRFETTNGFLGLGGRSYCVADTEKPACGEEACQTCGAPSHQGRGLCPAACRDKYEECGLDILCIADRWLWSAGGRFLGLGNTCDAVSRDCENAYFCKPPVLDSGPRFVMEDRQTQEGGGVVTSENQGVPRACVQL